MLMQHLTVPQLAVKPPAIARAPRLHVAIISDGNGRWATSRGLPRSAGHRAGAETARRIIEAAPRLGIHTLTLFALSSANWKRPAAEVRSEEHTSELQSQSNLVCRLLLEKKKTKSRIDVAESAVARK